MRHLRLTFAVMITLLGTATAAHAQGHAGHEFNDDGYFGVELMLGVAGSASVGDVSGAVTVPGIGAVSGGTSAVSSSDDLEATFGAGITYMHPLHRYFVLGGLFAVQSWQDRAGDRANASRSTLLDLSIVPEGRLPISDTVELYLALPLGLSMDFWKGAGNVSVAGVAQVQSSDSALGFNLSLLFGARFALAHNFGLFAEAGYAMHTFSHDIHVDLAGIVGDASARLTLEQLALHAGVFF